MDRQKFMVALSGVLAGGVACAQQGIPVDPAFIEEVALTQAANNSDKVGVASLLSPAAPAAKPSHAVQLTAGKDAGTANIKLQFGRPTARASTSIVGSVPLRKDSDRTDVWSPSGTVNGTRIELRHQRWWINGVQERIDSDLVNECSRLVDRTVPAEVRAGGTGCDPGLLKNYVDRVTYEDARGVLLKPNAAAISIAGGISVNYDDFTYYDPLSLEKRKERHRGAGLNVQAAYQPLDRQALYTISFEVERGLEAAESKIACLAGAGAVLSCVEGALLPPEKIWSRVLTLEYRAYLGSRAAISVQLARDFASHITAVQVPVYLVSDEKDGLTGGVAIGYFNDERKTQFAVFVTKAFSLWE